jgi:hypothetical protein
MKQQKRSILHEEAALDSALIAALEVGLDIAAAEVVGANTVGIEIDTDVTRTVTTEQVEIEHIDRR